MVEIKSLKELYLRLVDLFVGLERRMGFSFELLLLLILCCCVSRRWTLSLPTKLLDRDGQQKKAAMKNEGKTTTRFTSQDFAQDRATGTGFTVHDLLVNDALFMTEKFC